MLNHHHTMTQNTHPQPSGQTPKDPKEPKNLPHHDAVITEFPKDGETVNVMVSLNCGYARCKMLYKDGKFQGNMADRVFKWWYDKEPQKQEPSGQGERVKEAIQKYLEFQGKTGDKGWLQASVKYYLESGKVTGSFYEAIQKIASLPKETETTGMEEDQIKAIAGEEYASVVVFHPSSLK